MVTATQERPGREVTGSDALPRLDVGILMALCAAKLLLHLFTSVRHYGYFRDELYYLDLARHLDWGYVDCAPLIAVYAKVALLMGGSLAALRILPALAGAALIALTILIVRELGGNRYAQFLAGLCILLCPSILVTDSLLTMNAFEPLYWMGCILVIARILRTGDSRLWIWFGVLAGLGLENKHSTLFFGFAVTVALLLTHHRREFAKPWIWIAGAIALALFLPNLIWEAHRHFPTLEDLENVRREGKNVVLGPLGFVKQQIITMDPILLLVWVPGLIWLLRDRKWPVLGLTFVVFFTTMELSHGKDYYVFPIYPMLFAAGAVAIERWLDEPCCLDASSRRRRHRSRDCSAPPDGYLDAAARASACLSECHRLQAGEAGGPHGIAADAAHRGPVQLAGIGAASRRHLQLAAAGRARRNRHLGRQLWRSRSDQSVRSEIWIADGLLAPPEPLVLGTAAAGL